MEVDKQLKFKSHQRMQVEFISNNVDVMTHDCLSSVALALHRNCVYDCREAESLVRYIPGNTKSIHDTVSK